MAEARYWRHFDYVLLVVTILLTIFGVVMIYSANLGSLDEDLQTLWRRQMLFGVTGLGILMLLSIFPRDYQWLGDFWWLAFLIAVVLLVLVLFFGGSQVGNVSGWFDLGFITFQPAYLSMILLVISVGAVLSRRRKRSSDTPLFGRPKTSMTEVTTAEPGIGNYLASGLMTLVLAGLVFIQPDMATAAVLVVIWLAMVFESEIHTRYLVFTALIGLGALYPVWQLIDALDFGYMQDRVLEFLDLGEGVNYQVEQAAIAIGSGGLWGKGLAQGTQSQLRYLPVRHTDFIFAVTAEELGFVGVMVLFALYLILFYRLLRIMMIASDPYGRMLVAGTLAMILAQVVVNVGMNLGLTPVAGLPLPLISYGPAALLTTMMGIGLAENVAMRHRKLEF